MAEGICRLIVVYDSIRPKGERLKTVGGTASGYGSMMTMIDKIHKVIRAAGQRDGAVWSQLKPIDLLDIANIIGKPVMDRTELILEIFRRRAKSKEGRLQVELARLEHLSTRLVRGWTHLERQRGGLGKTGGPGEKQIELDRRMIASRVKMLRAQLKKLERQRDTQRRSRLRTDTLTVSLVGYTNAGKSTLFNALVREKTYAADQLFATLDTTARRCWVSDEETVILSDTVGFIRGLPHQLVEAFKSTLDETVHADVLLHVVDSSSPVREEQMASVAEVLAQIDADEIPVITVFNKIDVSGLDAQIQRRVDGTVKSVAISAATGAGLDLLRQALAETSARMREENASKPREPEPWELETAPRTVKSDDEALRELEALL